MADICWFSDPDSTSHALVGGKGANLGRLSGAGFTVPPGFTVTTEAHDRFLADGLLDRLLGLLSDAPDGLAAACARVREAVLARPLPEPVAAAIRAAYASLGNDAYVAVRSSGTAEDLAGASFAGLHDTYLDTRGADDVVDAVQRCSARNSSIFPCSARPSG